MIEPLKLLGFVVLGIYLLSSLWIFLNSLVMAQISRKNMKQLLATSLPLGKKLHGVFHLLSSFVFVCLFLNAVLTVPLLIFRNLYPEIMELTITR